MKTKKRYQLGLALLAALLSGSTYAAVSAEEAKQLGTTLTPWGAEKAGNKDGTIPAYSEEIMKAPASYNIKEPGQRDDPIVNEKPLFSITAQNADKYADKLDGFMALFKKYPNYRMDIYPTHRTATFPKYVQDNAIKNATSCKTDAEGLALSGCYGGTPFPIPKTGNEVMWNHLLMYEAPAWVSVGENYYITAAGDRVLQSLTYASNDAAFFNPTRTTPAKPNDIYWRVRVDSLAPARKVGEKLVVADQVDTTRRAYQYIPGQRRVKLAPDLAYDTPNPFGGGVETMDDSKTFLGSLDRYNWKLIGKKEKYITANNIVTQDSRRCPAATMLNKNFPSPDCMRFELRRVWVVEGTLKPGLRHIYKKRIFYWDEDGYYGGAAEMYDASGALFRVAQGLSFPTYGGGQFNSGNMFYDLNTGAYVAIVSNGCPGCGFYTLPKPEKDTFFSPEALAGEGIR